MVKQCIPVSGDLKSGIPADVLIPSTNEMHRQATAWYPPGIKNPNLHPTEDNPTVSVRFSIARRTASAVVTTGTHHDNHILA